MNLQPIFQIYRANVIFKPKVVVENYIKKVVSEAVNLPIELIFQNTRKKEVVFARQLYHYLMVRFTNKTIVDIGKLIIDNKVVNNYHHSTILHSVDSINSYLFMKNSSQAQLITNCFEKLKAITKQTRY